jgi:transcriptional regulator GlxA family with amidase domain
LPAKKRIGILVFDDFEPLDVWGFIEPFSIARRWGGLYTDLDATLFETVLISNAEGRRSAAGGGPRPVASFNGPRVAPDFFRNEVLDQQFDVLMVPGGMGVRPILHSSERLESVCAWLLAMQPRVGIMASVCTGAALLASSGLLNGLPATTNHAAFDMVAAQGPLVLWDNRSRWVDAGAVVTSAGVSAGTDMGFYLVERLAGRAVAEQAARAAEYDWQREP